ncbi:hypothetical protein [Streptomyces sp. NPDC050485]|uniref:hypothetical protein n=1 Tax=Streptomyces sp. NPDC050485 TaxID=3365617 RepID=UPI00379F9DC2
MLSTSVALGPARPRIGAFRFAAARAPWGGRPRRSKAAGRAATGVRGPAGLARALSAIDGAGGLVAQVLVTQDPLPRNDAELTLLVAGLRHHLPTLIKAAGGGPAGSGGPALVARARQLGALRAPPDHMPLVIHLIQLAEITQELIDTITRPLGPMGSRADGPSIVRKADIGPAGTTARDAWAGRSGSGLGSDIHQVPEGEAVHA